MDDPRHGKPQPWQNYPPAPGYGPPPPQGSSQPFPQQPFPQQQYSEQQYPQQQYPQQQPYLPVAAPPKRPKHVLHLILTILTCTAWANVWIVLTARYWNVVNYHDPREQAGMNRRTWITVTILIVLFMGSALTSVPALLDAKAAIEDARAKTAATGVPADNAAAKPASSPKAKAPVRIGDGTYEVGVDIKPGKYKSKGGETCYWERQKNDKGKLSSIIANSISPGPQVVTIRKRDYAFKTAGCARWIRQ